MRAWACSTRLVGVDQEGEAPPGGGRRGAAAAMILRLEVGSVWPEVHCARRN